MARLIGIDVGTSATKAILIDEKGHVLNEASHDYPLLTPQPGWAEQNPEDWWSAAQKCLADIGERPDAIGLTGQMHGSVFLDEHSKVVRPALLWCDQRTGPECEEIDRVCGATTIRDTTCNPPLPGFQLPKVLWLRNHEPERFKQVQHVLLPKDFIGHRLTGALKTEPSDASGTGAFDVPRRRWSQPILDALGLPISLFPEVVESSAVVGTYDGVPVIAGAGDQAAGAVGVGAVVPNVVSLSLGTSGVAFGSIPTPEPDPTGSAHVFCHANGGWHAMGVTLCCGGAIRWVRDTLFQGMAFPELENLAQKSPPGANGVTFSTYLAGERCPDLAPAGMGAFAGLSLSTSPADLARSAFEGAAFSLAACLDAIKQLGCHSNELRLTGGGAKSAFWAQMIADVTRTDCVTLTIDQGPALGAAILAGTGIGLWESVPSACEEILAIERRYSPGETDYLLAKGSHKRLYPALKGWAD